MDLEVPGKRIQVEIRRDTVEIRVDDRQRGVADRDQLRDWLRKPVGVFISHDVSWFAADGGIAIAIGDIVSAWRLTLDDVERLRERI